MSDLWKARLLPGSFRGIPFFIDSHELQGGRHAVTHEPPDRDKSFTEDIGIKAKKYKLDAHILGDLYFFTRDALISALEEEGSGILIHPYLGVKEVQTVGYSVSEDTRQGRICRLSMEFEESGDPTFPLSQIDAITDAISQAAVAVAQVKNAFQVGFSVIGLPAFAIASTEKLLGDFTSVVGDTFKNVRLNADVHSTLSKGLSDVAGAVSTLVRNPASLINEVDGIVNTLRTLVPAAPLSFTIDSSSGRDDKLAVFNTLTGFVGDSEDIVATTATRTKEKANAVALSDAIQQLAIIRLAEETIIKEFVSNEEAELQRNIVSDAISVQLLKENLPDETFQALRDLNAKLVKAVPNTDSRFNNVKTVEKPGEVPSLVYAFDLYEDLELEQDIIKRNNIREPGFIAGKVLVLSS